MHSKTLVCITCRLKGSTNFANHHVAVLFDLCLVKKSFKFGFLLFKFLNFIHDLLSFLKLTLFSKLFCFFVINIDLLFNLINFFLCLFLLNLAHLRLTTLLTKLLSRSKGSIFSSCKTPFDFLIDLGNHYLQLINKLILIPPLK